MYIEQFSPIRSGSTLVYNYLLELGKCLNKKKHKYNNKKETQYIITIRHPYNSIISSILRYGREVNVETIKDQINEYLSNGGNCILNNTFTNDKIHCVLRYEDFLNNHDLIFEKFELFFNEKYPLKLKNEIKKKLEISSVKHVIYENNFTDFKQYDEKTHFHGKHISQFDGNTDYKIILNNEELKILENNDKFKKIIEKYYYY